MERFSVVTIPGMEGYEWVLKDVTHVDLFAQPQYFRVLALHQPAHMREEEPPVAVVRVCIRLTEPVVYSVISHPVVHGVLQHNSHKYNRESACAASVHLRK